MANCGLRSETDSGTCMLNLLNECCAKIHCSGLADCVWSAINIQLRHSQLRWRTVLRFGYLVFDCVFVSFLVVYGCCIHIDVFFFLAAGRRTWSTARAGMEAQAQWQCRHLEGVSCHLYGAPQNGTASSSIQSCGNLASDRAFKLSWWFSWLPHSCPMVTPNLCLIFSWFPGHLIEPALVMASMAML